MALGALAAYPLGASSAGAATNTPEGGEKNPRIHAALEALHGADTELKEAKHDFHGHREAAQKAVQHAIKQLDIIKDW
jgi:nicotinamide mononucleotide (NMN) deamidase PncC